MSKQVGSRLRQIAKKIRTGKFYSGIVFTNCTKKRPREPETGIKDGTRISIWSILFCPAKLDCQIFRFRVPFPFQPDFPDFPEMVNNHFTSLYIADEVRAIRTSNIRLFWNCFALNFGICLLNNSSKVEIQNKPLKLKKVLRSWITLSLLEQLPFCWLLTCRMNVFVTFLKHHEPFPMNFMLAATIVQLAEIAAASSDFRGISGFLKT